MPGYTLLEWILIYLTIISGFINVVVSYQVGPITIFPFRALLPGITFFFGLRFLRQPHTMVLWFQRVKNYIIFLLLWITYAITSILWAIDKNAAILNIIFLSTGIILLIMIVYYIKNLFALNKIINAWTAIFFIMIAIGIWEINTGNHLPGSGYLLPKNYYYRFYPSAVFYNTNDFATYISLSLPIVLATISHISSKPIKWAMILIALLTGLFVLYSTQSRSNYIAVILEVLFWFLFLRKGRISINILAVLALTALFITYSFPTLETNMASTVNSQINSIPKDISEGSVRWELYMDAFTYSINSFGFGVGAGNVEYYLSHYPIYNTIGGSNTHNWWLEILANYGIWIFIGYILFYIFQIRGLYRIFKNAPNTIYKLYAEGFLISLIGFSVASASSSSILSIIPQWILFGSSLAFINISRRKIGSW